MSKIVITGGSDGLGKAMAAALSKSHKVVIVSSDEQKLSQTARQIGCEYKVCDVRDYAQVQAAFDEIGNIDCLINNAGKWLQGALDETDADRINDTIQVNALGTIYCTKAALPALKRQGRGLIINVVSQAGLNARAGWPVYIASKWAITGFTKSMQQELEPFGIRVTGFYPGTINTDLFVKAGNPKDMSQALDPEQVAATVEYMLGAGESVLFTEVGIKPFAKR